MVREMRKESTISLFIPGDDKDQNKAGTMDLKTMGLLGDSERILCSRLVK